MSFLKPRHALVVAVLPVALGAFAFACGSNDALQPNACEGGSCEAGLGDEGSHGDGPSDDAPSGDAADAGADAWVDANVDADAAHPPYTGKHIWSKLFGSNASSAVQGARIATDSAGNVFVAGTLTGDADFGGGALTGVNADVYVAKFTKDGQHVWSKRFGDSNVQGAGSVVVDAAGSVFVGGNFDGSVDFGGGVLTSAGLDVFVAKFDTNGNHLWSKRFGDAQGQDLAGGMTLVGSDVILTGTNSGSVDFGGGALTRPTYLARLSGSNGAHVWSKQPATGGFQPRALTTDAAGNIVGVGALVNAVPMDWGQGTLTSAGGDDALVIKFDSSGNTLWSKRFGDAQAQDAWDVATDASNNIVVIGRVQGALDFGAGMMSPSQATVYAAKLNPSGVGVWSKAFPAIAGTLPFSTALAVDAFGNVAIAGQANEAMDFGGGPLPATSGTTNIFIGKFDGAGKHMWSKGWAAGGGGIDGSMDLAFDVSGNMLFAGSLHQSMIDLGGGPLASIGAGGFLVLAKFAP